MGREIEAAALKKGYGIVLKADKDNTEQLNSEILGRADVALEFTTPDTAEDNIIACFNAGVPVVCGTTGWTGRLPEIECLCREKNQALFYSSNFSIGVNIMFRLNRWLAGVMNRFPAYDAEIEEIHHIHKKDSPSGTAITLAEDMLKELERKTGWINDHTQSPELLPVISERTGEVPGTHTITYRSHSDVLEIRHRALSRSVFATGAVIAAEFIRGKTGVFKMEDLLKI